MKVELLGKRNEDVVAEEAKIIATAGRLSRTSGTVTDVYEERSKKTAEQNIKYIKLIMSSGHTSIIEHISFNLKIEDVSPIVEQRLIMERISAFTIKSRREVDFTDVGYYIPDFHDKNGNIHRNNGALKEVYKLHMNKLFEEYNALMNKIFIDVKGKLFSKVKNLEELSENEEKKLNYQAEKIAKEDARYILPYCFNSNIVMTINAHTFCDLIIDLKAGKSSTIGELNELGSKLYEIMEKNAPYLKEYIDKNIKNVSRYNGHDLVLDELRSIISNIDGVRQLNDKRNIVKANNNLILDKPILLNSTSDIDRTIFTSSLERVFGCNADYANKIYDNEIKDNDEIKQKLIRIIKKLPGGSELSQVNFEFQVPLSYAALTHLTRHRTHSLLIPDFDTAMNNLGNYIIPESIIDAGLKEKYREIYDLNIDMFNRFKSIGVRKEDLIYFHLAGNMVNAITNMNGDTLKHIASLRCCNKAQWEIRDTVLEMKRLASEQSLYLGLILGPSCEVYRVCNEGRESCGKIKKILKNNNNRIL